MPILEKVMAAHSSALAWKIPWTEEPGGLQSMGSLGVGQDWATSLSLSCIGAGNGNPLQCSCLENPRDGGAWWAAVYGVAQSRTRLKRLSSSGRSSRSAYMLIPVTQFVIYLWATRAKIHCTKQMCDLFTLGFCEAHCSSLPLATASAQWVYFLP